MHARTCTHDLGFPGTLGHLGPCPLLFIGLVDITLVLSYLPSPNPFLSYHSFLYL